MNIQKVKKLIYYYELQVDFDPSFTASDGNLYRELFHRVLTIVQAKDPSRYVIIGEKTLFINDIDFKPTENVIIGKLRMIKSEFPELLHTGTDVTREIEAAEEEGIVETTHFMIDYLKDKKYLAVEYYQNGPKYLDLIDYITAIAQPRGWISSIRAVNVIQDVLSGMKNRINNISELYVKVSKTNVDALKKIDTDLWKALDTMQDHFEMGYAEIRFKFDYTEVATSFRSTNKVMKIINKLIGNKKHLQAFDTLKIKAEDRLKRNKLEAFNLLIDNLSSEITVEKRLKSRVISSVHMFQQMSTELESIRPRLK